MYVKNLGSGDDIYAGDEGAPDNADLVHGGAGNDQISGGLDADGLHGDDGDDLLNGGAGDDVLDGGDGDDTAVFSGTAGDYVWSGDNISATISGPDGTDALTHVEHLKFGSTVINPPAPNIAPGAPTDGDAAANIVAEGAVNGTAVAGLALTAIDPDAGQTLTYSLLDNAGGRFAIDASTGVVTVANAGLLNFEAATSHQIAVQVSDGAATASASFTIQVTNVVPGAPVDSDPTANTVSENAANGAVVAGLTIAAADPNGGVAYSLVDDAGGRFAINAATGVVTVADASLLDYDVAVSHQITVRASDGTASAATDTTLTIDVTNAAPTTPADADTAANAISEGAANGALVGITASAIEARTGTVIYSLSDDAGGRFSIDAASGVVTVADATKLNFETASSHQITVRAADAQGAFSSQAFTIAVINVANGAPTDGDGAPNTISEGAANGAVVAGLAISATDLNGGPLIYSLTDNAGGRFAINAVTGVVTVANASLLNFEAATSHQITVQASSGAESAAASFTINVTNAAPAAPSDTNGAANLVSEFATNGTVVGGLTIAAPDPHGGTVTYSLTDNAGGRFAINASTGVVTVANASLLDADIQASHTIAVQASDGILTSTSSIVIDLIDQIDSYWTGTIGNNTFTVPDVQDWQIDGGGGIDTLTGGVGDDIIIGGTSADILAGGGGNDIFLIGVGHGADAFDGGSGYDTIKASAADVAIGIGSMTGIEAFSSGGFANVTIAGSSGIDNFDFSGMTLTGIGAITGGLGNDVITGSNGNDVIRGDGQNDTLYGGNGNDILDGGTENDSLYGGAGDDIFLVGLSAGVDSFDGGAGYDTVQASAANAVISFSALTGVEAISSGGFSNVSIAGTANADTLNFSGVAINGAIVIGGGAGNDTITGTSGNDVLRGDAGIDTIYGLDGNDTLDGGADNDSLYAGNGDDILLFGQYAGTDAYDGGAGFDEVRASLNGATLWFSNLTSIEKISGGGFANVQIQVQSAGSFVNWDFTNIQMSGIAMIVGGIQSDTIIGSADADTIYGGFGADTLKGGAGDDVFAYSGNVTATEYSDFIDGGAGWDKLLAQSANATIQVSTMTGVEEISTGGFSGVKLAGYAAADTIDLRNVVITGALSVIDLGGGNDTFYGTGGADIIAGGTGNDIIDTGAGDDIIQMSFGNGVDVVHGGAGYDKIVYGSGGNVNILFNFDGIEEVQGDAGHVALVKIVGTTGDDVIDMRGIVLKDIQYITGDYGNDVIHGSYGDDFIMGDRGFDTIYGESGDDKIWFTAYGDTDVIDGGSGYDTLIAWNDGVIIGFSAITSIEAISAEGHTNVGIAFTDGNDNFDLTNIAVTGVAYIDLKAGNDIFVGSTGADRIIGNLGADTMTGGAGADIFDYNAAAEGIGDVITDFVSGVDKIDLSTIDAVPVGGGGGNEAFSFLGTGSFTGSQGQLRYSVVANGVVFSGDVNGDGVADFNVTVTGLAALSASDFIL